MPKEVIYGDLLPFDEQSPARSIVEVSWSREAQHVQMATKCVHAATEEVYRPGMNITVDTPNPQEEAGLTGVVPELSFYDGFYVQLNRQGINELIRHLRRARDAAFGRDE